MLCMGTEIADKLERISRMQIIIAVLTKDRWIVSGMLELGAVGLEQTLISHHRVPGVKLKPSGVAAEESWHEWDHEMLCDFERTYSENLRKPLENRSASGAPQELIKWSRPQ